MGPTFEGSFAQAATCLSLFREDPEVLSALNQVAECLTECFISGRKAISCGNGGSLADAMHFAEEWTGRFRNDRRPYPAIALSDPTHLTCVANDYTFNDVFARGVRALGKPGDFLLLLSTSGNSENLVLAAQAGKEAGMKVVGFLGKGGGRLAPLCDLVVEAPGETSDRIQELHMLALHVLIEVVEARLAEHEGAPR